MAKKKKAIHTPLTHAELEILQDYNRASFWSLLGSTQALVANFEAAKK